MTVKDNLIAAKALIDTPEKWIKGELSWAGCYCTVGAIDAAVDWDEHEGVILALRASMPYPCSIIGFNDAEDTTHADIMALFDRAIAAQDEVAK